MHLGGKHFTVSNSNIRTGGTAEGQTVLPIERIRDGFIVVHVFPKVGSQESWSRMEAFRRDVARMLLRAAEDEAK